jgi:hypothetical protein
MQKMQKEMNKLTIFALSAASSASKASTLPGNLSNLSTLPSSSSTISSRSLVYQYVSKLMNEKKGKEKGSEVTYIVLESVVVVSTVYRKGRSLRRFPVASSLLNAGRRSA